MRIAICDDEKGEQLLQKYIGERAEREGVYYVLFK